MSQNKLNKKQIKKQKMREMLNFINDFEKYRGDELCCGLKKLCDEFPPSALKCICKNCGKKIKEKNRAEKIANNEKYYIIEKIKSTTSRVGIFSSFLKCSEEFFYSWVKSQSTDTFNEHLDHIIPVNYFKKFTNASKYLSIRDSWINIMPLEATKNLQKSYKVDLKLFEVQLKKTKSFIKKYTFETAQERADIMEHYEYIFKLYKWLEC